MVRPVGHFDHFRAFACCELEKQKHFNSGTEKAFVSYSLCGERIEKATLFSRSNHLNTPLRLQMAQASFIGPLSRCRISPTQSLFLPRHWINSERPANTPIHQPQPHHINDEKIGIKEYSRTERPAWLFPVHLVVPTFARARE